MFAERSVDGAEPPVSGGAILVPLFEEDGEARVVLILRSTELPRHPGEIGLPGGGVEAGETMVEAALREAQEEVGIPPEAVEVIGWLDQATGRTSGWVVTPIVGLLSGRHELQPQPAEVEAAFDVALSDLLAVYSEERWGDRSMHFFDLGEDMVWGMTARVLYQLLSEVTGQTGPPSPEPARGREGRTPPAPA